MGCTVSTLHSVLCMVLRWRILSNLQWWQGWQSLAVMAVIIWVIAVSALLCSGPVWASSDGQARDWFFVSLHLILSVLQRTPMWSDIYLACWQLTPAFVWSNNMKERQNVLLDTWKPEIAYFKQLFQLNFSPYRGNMVKFQTGDT